VNAENERQWCPFRPSAADLEAIGKDVAKIPDIQRKLLANDADLEFLDRVAQQYQIAGSRVVFQIANDLHEPCAGSGFFSLARSTAALGESPPGWTGRTWKRWNPASNRMTQGINDGAAQDCGRRDEPVISPAC
jgi:hypothetical protein